MPVKRRTSKRRVSPHAEAEAWFTYWTTGHDFFNEAAEMTGLVEPVNVAPAERPAAEAAWRAASEEAWQRSGHLIAIEPV